VKNWHGRRIALDLVWLGIVILAGVRSFALVHYDAKATVPQTSEAVRVAYILHSEGRFADPFATFRTGPTAHIAPGFPAILAAVYSMFGIGARGAFAAKFLEATMLVLQVALIPLVAMALGAGRITGFLAACLAIGGMRHSFIWEANYVAVLLIVATLIACRYLVLLERGIVRGAGFNPWGSPAGLAWIVGVLWGVLLLIAPNVGPIWIAWILGGAWLSRRRGFRHSWLPAALAPLCFLGPWVVRNEAVFHKIIPVRDNFGLELAVGNNPCAKVSYTNSLRSGCFQHPYAVVAEAQKLARIGEAEYNHIRMMQAVAWIRANPGDALSLWTRRAAYFWFPSLNEGGSDLLGAKQRWSAWTINLMTILTVPGLVLLWRTARPGAAICAIFLGTYPLIYYVVQFIERYRLPIMWVTFILAAVTIRSFMVWVWSRRATTLHDPPVIANETSASPQL
jgi:hypothetical protein